MTEFILRYFALYNVLFDLKIYCIAVFHYIIIRYCFIPNDLSMFVILLTLFTTVWCHVIFRTFHKVMNKYVINDSRSLLSVVE